MSLPNDRYTTDETDGQCFGKLPSNRDNPLPTAEESQTVEGVDSNIQRTKTPPNTSSISRPVAEMSTERDSDDYNMDHERRGKCLVFYFSDFDAELKRTEKLDSRICAEEDKEKLRKSFEGIGFEVEAHKNLTKDLLLNELLKVSLEDHTSCDCLALVFMSHGGFDQKMKEQKLWVFDDSISPQYLWKDFVGSNCRSLVGKPKLFFIQACRGFKTDKGLSVANSLVVSVDGPSREVPESYTIPSQADLLTMWATYPGHYAFKSNNKGITGSVFIHFLCRVLEEEGSKRSLISLLTIVARKVAIVYESFNPNNYAIDANKQMPIIESTLIRDVRFYPKKTCPRPTAL